MDKTSSVASGVPITVNGGLGTKSYFKHSSWQKLTANLTKETIEDAIIQKLDVKSLLSNSNTIRIADLGCAVGPNTIVSMQELVHVIKKIYKTQCPNSPMPEFQVFFNDQTSNDFNTLFASLPNEREFFAAGVPGSFYGRLFPNDTLHLAHVYFALHWLSREPEGLEERDSLAWNRGRIHYCGAPSEVLKAYASQWAKDFGDFLDARAKEIVPGGLIVVLMPSIPDDISYLETSTGMMFECMATILLDMAKRGLITEEQVDSFNLPIYAAPPGEFCAAVETNGCFSVELQEMFNPAPWLAQGVHIDMVEFIMHIRAAMEGMFVKHFAVDVVDELFQRLEVNLSRISEKIESAYVEKCQAYYVLQRK